MLQLVTVCITPPPCTQIEATFEKAKQQAAASGTEEEEERPYQPLKAHAT
jgi:hypothetical protein